MGKLVAFHVSVVNLFMEERHGLQEDLEKEGYREYIAFFLTTDLPKSELT
jgi:hypothetical protein